MKFDFRIIKLLKQNDLQNVYLLENKYNKYFVLKEAKTEIKNKLLEKEKNILVYLNDKASLLNCPKVIEFGNRNGYVYLIESYIPGLFLNDVLKHKEDINNISNDFNQNLSILHSVDYGGLFDPISLSWRSFLLRQLEKYEEKIAKNKFLNYTLFKPVFDFDRYVFSTMDEPAKLVILHNDLNSENVLYNKKNKTVAFIDFERWTVGDPLKDISKMVWIFRENFFFRDLFLAKHDLKLDCYSNFIVLKSYFFYDILFHFSLYNEIFNYGNWGNFFQEEFEIISDFGDNNKWLTRYY